MVVISPGKAVARVDAGIPKTSAAAASAKADITAPATKVPPTTITEYMPGLLERA